MTDRTLRLRYKSFRKRILSFTPFVKRGRHNRAMARWLEYHRQAIARERSEREALGYLFLDRPPPAAAARAAPLIPIVNAATDELCLFVTHAASADLKPHVIDHVQALIDADIRVVLIANTDLEPASLRIPAELAARLQGCIVRENVGYDFGAWAHVYSMIDPGAVRRRLYLVNDSILGPLDTAAYRALLARIRESPADFVGMTNNPEPQDHLQSYYLVVNGRLLHSAAFDRFMRGVVNMPSKQNAIDCYEIWLTLFLQRAGFSAAAMFPNIAIEQDMRNDTIWSWKQLVALGFPFVKSGVLGYSQMSDDARRMLPPRYIGHP